MFACILLAWFVAWEPFPKGSGSSSKMGLALSCALLLENSPGEISGIEQVAFAPEMGQACEPHV